MKVSAVVISHGHAEELEHSLPALAPQVAELVVSANLPGSVPAALPAGTRVIENEAPLSFAANANLGADSTAHELVLIVNPDAVPEPDAVGILRDVLADRARWSRAGLERSRTLSWARTAAATAAVYREVLS